MWNRYIELPPSGAVFDETRAYRYILWRKLTALAEAPRPLVVCGLNPSIANEHDNDPTITREIGFARSWGCNLLVKVNAYGYISTDPKVMFAQRKKHDFNIVGIENDNYIVEALAFAVQHQGTFLVAWGAKIEPYRQECLAKLIGEHAQCLKTNKDGSPVHPLYQRSDSKPIPWKHP